MTDPNRIDRDGETPGEKIADEYQIELFEKLAVLGKSYGVFLIANILEEEWTSHGDDPILMKEIKNGLEGILADWDCNEESIRDFYDPPLEDADDNDL